MEIENELEKMHRNLQRLVDAYEKLRQDFVSVYQVRHPTYSLSECDRDVSKYHPTLEELMK